MSMKLAQYVIMFNKTKHTIYYMYVTKYYI